MKTLIGLILLLVTGLAYADTWVQGYTRKDGTVVQGHHRSSPNNTRNDNYSTRGNVNPYTGTAGYKPRDYEAASSKSSSHSSGDSSQDETED